MRYNISVVNPFTSDTMFLGARIEQSRHGISRERTPLAVVSKPLRGIYTQVEAERLLGLLERLGYVASMTQETSLNE